MATVPPGSVAPTPRRLDHIDALRVIACLSVLLIHVITETMSPDGQRVNAVTQVLHYGRNVFFFVSAFVLTYVFLQRHRPDLRSGRDGAPFDATKFRARRLRLIGVPYLLWTVAYLLYQNTNNPEVLSRKQAPLQIVADLATGQGYFHLYFLLVTLQFGMVFPAFIWLLDSTRGYHVWLFVGSLTLQLAIVAYYEHVGTMPGDGYQAVYGEASLLAYQLWFVAGGLAAVHYRRFHDWIMRNTAAIAAIAVAAVGLGQLVYWYRVGHGESPFQASYTLQPVTMIWSLVAVALLYRIAVALMSTRFEWLSTAIRRISVLSFAIYLVHPAILYIQTFYGASDWSLGPGMQLLYTGAMVPAVALAAIAVGAVLHRTPWSLALIGRPRKCRSGPHGDPMTATP
jgi:peptidoglycan/LPS O-acetylase OafA/YrhL